MTATPSALNQLIHKDAIWECMLRYSRGLDRLDIDLFRSAYWEDALTCHGPCNGSVDEFLDWWLPLQKGREVCQHTMTNLTVKFVGDGSADAETYFVSYLKSQGEHAQLLGGRYVDHFEKRNDEWRIKTRLLIFEWEGKVDSAGMQERLSINHRGSRDNDDPSYESPVIPRREKPNQ